MSIGVYGGPYGALYYAELGLYGGLMAYGTQRLTVTSPAQSFTEPLQLADVKEFLKIPQRSPTDSAEDALLSTMISAARSVVEQEAELELIQRQWDFYFDTWPGGAFEIGKPLISVDLMQYRDSNGDVTTLEPGTDYLVDTNKMPGLVMPPYNATWPNFTAWPTSALLIRATTGYASADPWWSGEAGRRALLGMQFLITEWYNNRLPFSMPVKDMPPQLQFLLSLGRSVRAR